MTSEHVTVEYGTGSAPTPLLQARARAESVLRKRWEAERTPRERYRVSFSSGWGACGEVMSALDKYDAEDMTWSHDEGRHKVEFACTPATFVTIRAEMCKFPVRDKRYRWLSAADGDLKVETDG